MLPDREETRYDRTPLKPRQADGFKGAFYFSRTLHHLGIRIDLPIQLGKSYQWRDLMA